MSTHELLNVLTVDQAIKSLGFKKGHISKLCGLSRTAGYVMLRNGVLPMDPALRKRVLGKLSKLLGLTPAELVVCLTRDTDTQ